MLELLIIKVIIFPIILTVFGVGMGLVYKGIDRKLAAHMQARIGPPIRQPFRDVRKLFVKENIVPENAIPWLFNTVPVIALVASISILFYLPIGGFKPLLHGYGDLILILYLLAIPALAMALGGFASGSPYATVGAQREIVQMISYEFPLAVAVISIVWKISSVGIAEPFALQTIALHPIWELVGPLGTIGGTILLLVLLTVTPIELSKIPFDVPEAETEIAGGVLVEYSGRNLAMFYLTDAVKTVAIASLVVVLFFPWGISPVVNNYLQVGMWLSLLLDFLFFLLKVFLVIFIAVTFVRVAFARLKISQVSYIYFLPLTLLAFGGLVCVVLEEVL